MSRTPTLAATRGPAPPDRPADCVAPAWDVTCAWRVERAMLPVCTSLGTTMHAEAFEARGAMPVPGSGSRGCDEGGVEGVARARDVCLLGLEECVRLAGPGTEDVLGWEGTGPASVLFSSVHEMHALVSGVMSYDVCCSGVAWSDCRHAMAGGNRWQYVSTPCLATCFATCGHPPFSRRTGPPCTATWPSRPSLTRFDSRQTP